MLVFPLGQAKQPLEKLFVAAVHILLSAFSLGSRTRRLFSRRRHWKISPVGGWFCASKGPAVPPQLCRCNGHVITHQRCRVFRPVAAAMLPYPETCTVLLPMDATAFYHVSHSAAFCSFVAEVRGRCSALARRDLLLLTLPRPSLPPAQHNAWQPVPQQSVLASRSCLQSSLRGKVCKAVLVGRQGCLLTRKPADSTSSGCLAACRKLIGRQLKHWAEGCAFLACRCSTWGRSA